MKQLNAIDVLSKIESEASRQATLDMLILNQIEILEKLIEKNADHVRSPLTYNYVGGLLDQLKLRIPEIFKDAPLCAPVMPDGWPVSYIKETE